MGAMARPRSGLPSLDAESLPGPSNIHRWELDNGIILLLRENHASPSIVLAGYLAAGAIGETIADAGLAHLCAGALMRGTARRSFQEIYQDLESIGASFGFGAGKQHTSFHGKALAEDLGLLLGVLSETVRAPAFPEAEVERLRNERLTALNIRDQDTGAVAGMAFDRLAYPDHPYAIPPDGTKESVSGLRREDLAAFHRRSYGPKGMVLSIVGAVHAKETRRAVERVLGDWRNEAQVLPPPVPGSTAPKAIVRQDRQLPGKTQCDLVIGTPGPARTDSDYLAAALGNSILGRFGLYGRVGDAVREREGLAYYAYSSLGGGLGPGPWSIMAGVNPANVERAITLIRKEIGRFVSRRVTPGELEENQSHFIGRLPLQLESNEGVASALLNLEKYDLGLDYYVRYADQIGSIGRDAILAAARRFLSPDRLAIAVAGPGLDGRAE
jgi:zinc protease